MANTSPRHMPVLDNVHPIKIENVGIFFRDVISLLALVVILLIDTLPKKFPLKIFERNCQSSCSTGLYGCHIS